MHTTRLAILALTLAVVPLHAELTPEEIKSMPPAEIEKVLPQEHPRFYYIYAGRLFSEGKKDEAVFWFYVGELRYRFHLKANPKLDPSADPALFGSFHEVYGKPINEYAGGNIGDWVKAIDRALKWDAETENGFTSKTKFLAIYEANRAGLKKIRDQIESQTEKIREQRKKAGLENRG